VEYVCECMFLCYLYMSVLSFVSYVVITFLLHLPFNCPLVLLPFLFPQEEITIISEVSDI